MHDCPLIQFVKNGCWQHVLDTTSAFLCAHGQGPPVPSNAATNVPADADAEGAQENQSQPQPPGKLCSAPTPLIRALR